MRFVRPHRIAPAVAGVVLLSAVGCAQRCAVKPSETAELYPTFASYDERSGEWKAPVHGRVYESALGATAKSALSLFRNVMNLPETGSGFLRFEERAELFLTKAPGGRKIRVRMAGDSVAKSRLDAGGHFQETVSLSEKQAPADGAADRSAPVALKGCGDGGDVTGEVFFLDEKGTSVISTVEDTVQEMGLGRRAEVFANLFFREYRPIDGMSTLYESWRNDGADFHYVAAAPWQLYAPVSSFMASHGFPSGTFHMARWGGGDGAQERLENVLQLFGSDLDHKTAEISRLLESFPQRDFILIGNTAGTDPAAFARIAKRYPGRVRRIYLRETPAGGGDARAALEGLPLARVTFFKNPRDLSTDLSRL